MKKIIAATLMAFGLIGSVQAQEAAKVYTGFANVSYDPELSHKFDLYIPDQSQTPKGLILWVHGGGWIGGDKADEDLQALIPAFNKGVAVVSMNYRLGFNGAFPNGEIDVKKMLKAIDDGGCPTCDQSPVWSWIKKYADKGIVISGGSAGGHLSVWAGTSYLLDKQNLGQTTKLKCINNNVGPMDVRNKADFDPRVWFMVETHANNGSGYTQDTLNAISPTWWIQNTTAFDGPARKVKWILNNSAYDKIVPIKTNYAFTKALRAKGAIVYNNTGYDYISEESHNVSMPTKIKWLNQVASVCLGVN
jgi:hypothetical protein